MGLVAIFILFCCTHSSIAQVTIARQGGESGDCWGYSGGRVNQEAVRTGSSSLRVGRANEPFSLVFDTVNLRNYSAVQLTLWHAIRNGTGQGLEDGQGVSIQVSLDGGPWIRIGEVAGTNNYGYPFSQTGTVGSPISAPGWTMPNPLVYNVPAGTSRFVLSVTTLQDTAGIQIGPRIPSSFAGTDQGFYVDDVSLSGVENRIVAPTITEVFPRNGYEACQGQIYQFRVQSLGYRPVSSSARIPLVGQRGCSI